MHTYPAWLCPLSGWCTYELQLELSLEQCISDTSEGQRWCSRLHLEFWWSRLLLTEMTWLICWCDFHISVLWNGLQYSYSSRSHCHRQPHSSPQHSLHSWATHTCLGQLWQWMTSCIARCMHGICITMHAFYNSMPFTLPGVTLKCGLGVNLPGMQYFVYFSSA